MTVLTKVSKHAYPSIYQTAKSSIANASTKQTEQEEEKEDFIFKNRDIIKRVQSEKHQLSKIKEEFVKENKMRLQRKIQHRIQKLVETTSMKNAHSAKIKELKEKGRKLVNTINCKALKEKEDLKSQLKYANNAPLEVKIKLLESLK